MFRRVHSSRVSEEIASQIRQVILSGKLKPGDRLPTERELVEQFHSSRVSVREAVRSLEHLGLVKIKRGAGGGTYVTGANYRPVAESFLVKMQMSKGTVEHITEARLLLEPGVCRLAAVHATRQDLMRLRETVEDQEALVKEGRKDASYDLRFHQLLIEAAHNPILALTAISVMDLLVKALERARVSGGMTPHVVSFHRNIYNALRDRDGECASRLMADHIRDIQDRLKPLLAKSATPAAWVSGPLQWQEGAWEL